MVFNFEARIKQATVLILALICLGFGANHIQLHQIDSGMMNAERTMDGRSEAKGYSTAGIINRVGSMEVDATSNAFGTKDISLVSKTQIYEVSTTELEAAITELAVADEEKIAEEETQPILNEVEAALYEVANSQWSNMLMCEIKEYLNVRAEASRDSEIVGKMYPDSVAEVIEEVDGWYHITSGNVEGYVNADYCVTGDAAYELCQQKCKTYATAIAGGLRIRTEPSLEGGIIRAVTAGTSIEVDVDAQQNDEWVTIFYGGRQAYVSAEYVEVEQRLGTAKTKEEIAEEARQKASEQKMYQATIEQKEAVIASADEVTILAALIQVEAGADIYDDQLAVGAVVMNRVKSGGFPGSIVDVIYQKGQFSTGRIASIIDKGPKSSCIQAAQEAISGVDNTGGATHFRMAYSGHAGIVIGEQVFW